MRDFAFLTMGVVLAGVIALVFLRPEAASVKQASPALPRANRTPPAIVVSLPLVTPNSKPLPMRAPVHAYQALADWPVILQPRPVVPRYMTRTPMAVRRVPAKAPAIQVIPGSPSTFGGMVEPARTTAEESEWILREQIQISQDVASGLCSREVGHERFAKLSGRAIPHTGTIEIRLGPSRPQSTTQPEAENWISSLDRR